MELVYLWVEDYKNIHKEGFNFSPQFHCEYDEEKNGLTIEEDKNYIPDFFGDNINITALVGENGSGKSSVIECLDKIFNFMFQHNGDSLHIVVKQITFNFILVIQKSENNLFFISNLNDINTKINKLDQLYDWGYYIYSANEQKNYYEDTSENYMLYSHRIYLNENIIGNMITDKYISSTGADFDLTTFMYIPHEIEIKPISLYQILDDMLKKSEGDFYMDFFEDGLSDKEEERRRKDARNKKWAVEDEVNRLYEYIEDDFHRFLISWSIKEHGEDSLYYLEDKNSLIEEFKESVGLTEDEFYLYFKEQTKLSTEFSTRDKEIYFKYFKEYFEFDFIDSKNRRYQNLSHGEQTIFGQLLNIYYYSKNYLFKSICFLLDEPELSLHPQWQKMYLYELQNLLIQMDKKYHIFITSHSPFLLSDLPNKNVVFLKDAKQVDVDIDTFGANIHTLLSHGFFMKNGLIGEFAKNKIDKVIDYLNKKNNLTENEIKYCQNIISIIGEPILKKQLQKMLNDKVELSNKDEIDNIKKQIENLTNRLNEIEK